ncbi:ABC transporter permease [Candidatus Bathyarchaeota archaeon]|nr:ABC transporter permease [Candidatus Bathyarchaeota archaeon]
MKPKDILTTAFNGLNERKFRLGLNVLGILIGVAAVTGLVSITQGLTQEVSGQLEMFGPSNVMVVPFTVQPGRGLVGESFNWRDIQVIEKTPHVRYLSPIVGSKLASFTSRGETYVCSVYGAEPVYFEIFKYYEMADGRALVQSDKASVVLGHLVSQPRGLDKPIYEVGDRITLKFMIKSQEKQVTLRVVGVMEEVGGTFGSEDDNSVIIPFREAQQIFESGSKVDFVALTVDSIDNVDAVVEHIEDKFGDGVMVMSFDMIQQQVGQILGTIEAVLGGIAAISLLVAGVSIINTMTISVMERTREIGILKAIGGKSTDVLYLFLSEATITGLLGGVVGAVFGFILGGFVGDYIGLPVSTSPILGLGVVGFAVFTSVLAGLYPAWRASNLNPVEALRYE